MNKHGQTLIAFVIIVPAFILLLAFVVDTGLILNEKVRLESTTKTILENHNTDIAEIKDLYEQNDIPTTNLKITNDNNLTKITNEYEVESIFGKIIGLKSYKIKINMLAKEENDKIKIIKE